MCDIFPEVPNCCFIFSLRMGMMFISVCSIITGCITLSVIEQRSNINFNTFQNYSKNATTSKDVVSNLTGLLNTGITGMSVLFMFSGIFLLVATLSDQEGLAQAFVFLTFLAIMIGALIIVIIILECMLKPKCILENMDWLSASATLVIMAFYLVLWFYFVCVANSYVVNGGS